MTDFQSFLLGNMDMLGLKEHSGSNDSIHGGSATLSDGKSEPQYQTTSTIFTMDTLLTNTTDTTKSSCQSDLASRESSVSSSFIKNKKSSIISNKPKDEEKFNNEEQNNEERVVPVVPKRRTKFNLIEQHIPEPEFKPEPVVEVKNEFQVEQESDRDYERDANSPKPVIRSSISHKILNKFKNHDFSNIKTFFNNNIHSRDSTMKSTRHYEKSKYEIESLPKSKMDLSVDMIETDTILSMSKKDKDVTPNEWSKLLTAISQLTTDETPKQSHKNDEIDKLVQKLKSLKKTPSVKNDEKKVTKQIIDSSFYESEEDEEDIVSTVDHVYNEIKDNGVRKRVIKGNDKSDAEKISNESLREFENDEDEDEDEDENKKKSKRLLRKRLNELAKLKRPERRILYDEWFKIIKKLETDPKFDLETLIRTRGRFTDHVMISYRDRLLLTNTNKKITSETTSSMGICSAAGLNFFNQNSLSKSKLDIDDDLDISKNKNNGLKNTANNEKTVRAFKLTLKKCDIKLIKEKLNSRKNSKTSKFLQLISNTHKRAFSNSNDKRTVMEHDDRNSQRKDRTRIITEKPMRKVVNSRIDYEENCEEIDSNGFMSKYKNLKRRCKIEGFCDGLSKIVKDVENKLKVKDNKSAESTKRGGKERRYDGRHHVDETFYDDNDDDDDDGQVDETASLKYRLSNINEDSFNETRNFDYDCDSKPARPGRPPPPKRPPPPRPSNPIKKKSSTRVSNELDSQKHSKPKLPPAPAIPPTNPPPNKPRQQRSSKSVVGDERVKLPKQDDELNRSHHRRHIRPSTSPSSPVLKSKSQRSVLCNKNEQTSKSISVQKQKSRPNDKRRA